MSNKIIIKIAFELPDIRVILRAQHAEINDFQTSQEEPAAGASIIVLTAHHTSIGRLQKRKQRATSTAVQGRIPRNAFESTCLLADQLAGVKKYYSPPELLGSRLI